MKEEKSTSFETYSAYGSTTTNIVGSGTLSSAKSHREEEERPVTFATNYSDPEGKRRKRVMSDTWKPHLQIMGYPTIKVETYLAYKKGKGEPIINVWTDSIHKEENVYIELYDWNVCPVLDEQNKRTLYCLPYHPSNKTKYSLSGTGKAYTVPVSDLVVFATMEQETDINKLAAQEDFLCGQVNSDAAMHNYNSDGPMSKKYSVPLTPLTRTSETFSSKTEDEFVSLHKHLFTVKDDANIKELTIKDVFAMLRGVPVSDKEWLNEQIKNN